MEQYLIETEEVVFGLVRHKGVMKWLRVRNIEALMRASSQSALAFVLGHLQWCLEQSIKSGNERDSTARLARALERVGEAFDRHIDGLEAESSFFQQWAAPGTLPLLPETKQIAQLRESQQALRRKLRGLTAQLRDAMVLLPVEPNSSSAGINPCLLEDRACRLFGILALCVGDIVTELQRYMSLEAEFLANAELIQTGL